MSDANPGSCDECKQFVEHRVYAIVGTTKDAPELELCERCYEKLIESVPVCFHGEQKKIVRAAGALAEAYVAWAFEQASSLRMGLLGDTVRERFRDYLKVAHQDLFARMVAAEKKHQGPKLTIVGLKPPEVKPA